MLDDLLATMETNAVRHTATQTQDRKAAVNWRIRQAVRKGLRLAAVQDETTMEDLADRVLGEMLAARGLMPSDRQPPQPAA